MVFITSERSTDDDHEIHDDLPTEMNFCSKWVSIVLGLAIFFKGISCTKSCAMAWGRA